MMSSPSDFASAIALHRQECVTESRMQRQPLTEGAVRAIRGGWDVPCERLAGLAVGQIRIEPCDDLSSCS
jgi:hypothetical protein